jgi:hypothetical protein
MIEPLSKHLPVNDAQRLLLHNEIHTRPSATFKLPALVVYVAVLNSHVSTAEEFEHLKRLPQSQSLEFDKMKGNFLQLQCNGFMVIWERHSEFTRYTIVQPLPEHAQWGSNLPELDAYAATGSEWLKGIPGKTITAIHLALLNEGSDDPDAFYKGKQWLFTQRGLEYMNGWQDILEAMQVAVKECKKELEQNLAEKSSFKDKQIEAIAKEIVGKKTLKQRFAEK